MTCGPGEFVRIRRAGSGTDAAARRGHRELPPLTRLQAVDGGDAGGPKLGDMRALSSVVVLLAAGLLAGCTPGSVTDAASRPVPSGQSSATVQSVIDGDTIQTSEGTVRVIGIDAPERGECGYAEASALVSSILRPGDQTILELPDGENAEDRHGRILRYVNTTEGVDVALSLLTAGLAVARYDSTDGYPAHPREAEYHSAQTATLTPDGAVITTACKAAADQTEQARIAADQQAAEQQAAPVPVAPPAVDEWWKQYSSCTTLKKNPDGHPVGPFSRDNPAEAAIYEWFANGTGNNGDGEGDGLACE